MDDVRNDRAKYDKIEIMNWKRIIGVLLLASMVGLSISCSRKRVLSEEELGDVFHDIFLVNSYASPESRRIQLDSLNIYEPIFREKGYTIEDIQNTLADISRRKSAHLSDVLEKAIAKLVKEDAFYTKEVAVLDTIEQVACRRFTHTVFADSLIRVRQLKDTTRLQMEFDVQAGEYNLTLDYLIDSLDKNVQGIYGSVWLSDDRGRLSNNYNMVLRRNYKEHFKRRFITDASHRKLHVNFMHFRTKDARRPSITVSNMKLTYTPVKQAAVDSLYEMEMHLNFFPQTQLRLHEKDSL